MSGEVNISKKSNYEDLKKNLQSLENLRVSVGIPSKNGVRRQTAKGRVKQPNNAELMYLHTKGSPLQKIPSRPVIEPAIEDDRENLNKMFVVAGGLALNGKKQEVVRQFGLIGLRAEQQAKAWFTNPNNNWTPNTEFTIRQKGSNAPLIDTGQLRKAITYVVEE